MYIHKKTIFYVMVIFFALTLLGCQSLIDYEAARIFSEESFIYTAESENLITGEFNYNEEAGVYDSAESVDDTINGIYVPVDDAALRDQTNALFPVAFFITQDDASNVDMSVFVESPDFTPEENEQLIRTILYIALHEHGFDIGFHIRELIDKDGMREYLNRWGQYFSYKEWEYIFNSDSFFAHTLDRSFWIVTDFMLLATRLENDRVTVPVRIRSWPKEQPYLDSGSWLIMLFVNVDGQYRLAGMHGDA